MSDDILDDWEPLEAPTRPPQLETEANASLIDLLESAPGWDAAFAIELVVLARRHVCIRSLLGFPLELALEEQKKLTSADEPNEMFRHQGGIRALNRAHQIILDGLIAADVYLAPVEKEHSDELPSHLSP